MNLQIFRSREVDNAEFVDFWSKRYEYPHSKLYDNNIARTLTEESVLELYTWKNGNELSKRKRKSVLQYYVTRIGDTDKLDTPEQGWKYVNSLGGGAIWNVFWLHCRNRAAFPIFDQHTYRAMAGILDLKPKEIPSGRPDKIRSYFDQYLPLLKRFDVKDVRTVDKALFAYGQFLRSPFSLGH